MFVLRVSNNNVTLLLFLFSFFFLFTPNKLCVSVSQMCIDPLLLLSAFAFRTQIRYFILDKLSSST